MLRWEKTSPRLDHPGRGARDRADGKGGGEPLAPFPVVFVLRGRRPVEPGCRPQPSGIALGGSLRRPLNLLFDQLEECPDQRSTHPPRNSCSVSQVRLRPPSADSSLLSGKRSTAGLGWAGKRSLSEGLPFAHLSQAAPGWWRSRLSREGEGLAEAIFWHYLLRAVAGEERKAAKSPGVGENWRPAGLPSQSLEFAWSCPARLSRDHLCCLASPGAHLPLVARPFYGQPLPPFPPQISEAHSLPLREGERDKYEKTRIILPGGIT